jgi:outer membrane protein assembly factor BamB
VFGGVAAVGGLASGAFTTVPARQSARRGAVARDRRPGTLLWYQQAGSVVRGAFGAIILAADGMVYVSSSLHGEVGADTCAIEAATGKVAWQARGPVPYDAGAGAVFGFEITGGTAEVVAVSAAAGRTIWTYDVSGWLGDDAWNGYLAYGGEMVYIAPGTTKLTPGMQPAVRTLDARTGRLAWAASLASSSQYPLVADGILCAVTDGRVVALHGEAGTRLWESAPIGGIDLQAITDGVVCLKDGQDSLLALDSATGRQMWQLGGMHSPTVAATAGDLIVVFQDASSPGSTFSPTLQARYARSGKLAWSRAAAGIPVTAADGVLYLLSGQTLLAMAALTGDTLWSYPLPPAVLVWGVAAGDDVAYAYTVDQAGSRSVYALQA